MAKKISYDNWSKEELIKELSRIKETKYGLVWHRDLTEEKIDVLINPDARTPSEMFPNEMAGKPFPVLKEVKSKEIKTDKSKPVNLLIEGDNYHSLAVLNFTHEEAIDLIYIDPPYNTGNNDFIYNDKYVDKEDGYRHSKWLAFMEKRLKLAKKLLKESGVIFISIGDDEFAQLKLLLDDPGLFTENNFVACIPRVAKTASNKGKHFAPSVDYILVYAKNIEALELFKDEVDSSLYKKKDEKGFYRDDVALYQSALDSRPNQRYFIKCPDGSLVIPPGDVMPDEKKDASFVKPKSENDKVWRWSYSTYLEKKDILVYKETKNSPLLDQNGNQAKWNIYTKSYLSDRQETGTVPRNFLDQFINRQGADFLKTMDISFDYSKPVELIKYLIKITDKKNDITVLDFMAGSGTTGQAVLELNNEDGGTRNFILGTNNELNGFKKELEVKGFSKKEIEERGICRRITYPRLEKIIKGYKNTKGENIAGLGGNLKYYTCDFVEAEPSDKNKRKLVSKSTEMLCIHESAFELVQDKDEFKIFKNSGKHLGIIFHEDAIDDYKKAIKKMNGRFNTYVFSMTDDPHKADFADMEDKVKLCAIPEVILKVYREIFK
ncbi:MAG: Methyltransferase [Parcubacteria group bacterium GW2011_GWB1_44_7]|nr:MAG: Methyltransferase [Parcubacteria group bacterium GW2011_GWB1_44_7]